MNSKIIKKITFLAVMLIFNIQQMNSQNNVVQKNVEFNKIRSSNDLNSIDNLNSKKQLRKKTKNKIAKDITIKDLERIVANKRKLRYRSRRNHENKCFSDKADSCNTEK